MQSRKTMIILLISLFIDLSVLLYPAISSHWNLKTRSEAIFDYESMLENYKPEDDSAIFEAADAYNAELWELEYSFMHHGQRPDCWEILNINGTGMMGNVTIKKINQELQVYHGTGDSVLSIAAGHYQSNSLSVGGKSTHSVVSAYRGFSTAVLFIHLDRMEIGDTFYFTILDRSITYEVDQMPIVALPIVVVMIIYVMFISLSDACWNQLFIPDFFQKTS